MDENEQYNTINLGTFYAYKTMSFNIYIVIYNKYVNPFNSPKGPSAQNIYLYLICVYCIMYICKKDNSPG